VGRSWRRGGVWGAGDKRLEHEGTCEREGGKGIGHIESGAFETLHMYFCK